MLSREDNRRLAQLERQLRRDDPQFCERMAGHGARKRISATMVLTATTVWVAALILAVTGWWIAASVCAVSATGILATALYRGRRPGPPRHQAPGDSYA